MQTGYLESNSYLLPKLLAKVDKGFLSCSKYTDVQTAGEKQHTATELVPEPPSQQGDDLDYVFSSPIKLVYRKLNCVTCCCATWLKVINLKVNWVDGC